MIRFTGYGVTAEKPCVGQVIYPELFHAPCRKNYVLDGKMMTPFFNDLDSPSPFKMQTLGEIELRAPAVDTKMWCLCVCLFFVCHAPSLAGRSLEWNIL